VKNFYNNLRIRTKIWFGFCIVTVIMLLMIAYTLIRLGGIIASYENLKNGHWPRRDTRYEYRHSFESMQRHANAMIMYASIGNTANIEQAFSNAQSAFQNALASLQAYDKLVTVDNEIPYYEKQLRHDTSRQAAEILESYYRNVLLSVFQYSMEGDFEAGIQTIWAGEEISNFLVQTNIFLDSISYDWIEGVQGRIRRYQKLTYGIIAIALTLIAIVTICITILTASSISGPIGIVTNTLRDISKGEGDLTTVIKTSAGDEVGKLARYFNQTLEKSKNLVIEIKYEAERLSSIGDDLAVNMGKAAQGVSKITSNVQSIRGRVAKQSASVSQSHTNMNDLLSNINNLDDNVETMSGNVSTASAAIEEMAVNIRSVTDTLNKNDTNVKSLMEASDVGRAGLIAVVMDIQGIAKESFGLLEINSVIENLANETNILSINAAIQAAQAGVAGNGFAVVANEIRKLAENSSRQSQTTGQALKKMKNSIDKITKSAETVMERFEAIDDRVKIVAQEEDRVLSAMEAQEIASRQIVQGVVEISNAMSRVKVNSNGMLANAEGVIKESEALEKEAREINSSMIEVAGEAGEINRAVSQINDTSNENLMTIKRLFNGISRFKVS